MINKTIDVAIVGGGPAGTYIAYRLSQHRGVPGLADVHLYEASERIGGRLLSVSMPGMPYTAELGGMRFTKRHVFVSHFAEMLELDPQEFRFDTSHYFLRGCRGGIPDLQAYRLGHGEQHNGSSTERSTPADLIKLGIRSALRDVTFPREGEEYEAASLSPEQRRDLRHEIKLIAHKLRDLDDRTHPLSIGLLRPHQWEVLRTQGRLVGKRLRDIGFWNLLQHYLSCEGFLYAHDGLGYESVVANWNAAEAIPWYLQDFDVTYMTLKRGMQKLPQAFNLKFRESRGETVDGPSSCVHLNHELRAVTRDGGEMVLTFRLKGERAGEVHVRARRVVLALPKNALAKIRFPRFEPGQKEDLRTAVSSVTAHPMLKLFLGYDEAWWLDPRGIGVKSGRAVTDLPIRQVYYIGPDKALEPTRHAMLMASYSDAHYVGFWSPLNRWSPENGLSGNNVDDARRWEPYYHPRGDDGAAQPFSVAEAGVLAAYGTSEGMVQKAHRQVKQLHPELAAADAIPAPIVALVKEWDAGWHTWNVHRDPRLVMRFASQPFDDLMLHIAGEAYSCEQGWVEGALRSAERVLRILDVPPPDIPDHVYDDQGYTGYDEYVGFIAQPGAGAAHVPRKNTAGRR